MHRENYNIVCTTWHVMHYYDLFMALKEHATFTLLPSAARSWRDPRFLALRPIPANVRFAPYYESGKYDLALLSLDQQCVNPDIGKSKVFNELNAAITDIPKVIINHGSPVFPGYLKHGAMTDADAEEECRHIVREMVGDNVMVVNSYTAASEKEWGWGHPIWHGMGLDEWYGLVKEPRVCSALSPAGLDEYYNRMCMTESANELRRLYGYELQWARVTAETESSWDAYRNFLGKSLVYLDTSTRTPMNRARTEAMLSGCCVVQVQGAHDLDRFAKDGENMVLVPNNPEKIAHVVGELLQNPERALAIGKAGQATASQLFNRERYKQDWLALLESL